MSLFYSVENVEIITFQGISKTHKVPLGLITKSLKDSISKVFEKSANILLTDFRLTLSKTRQNPPKYRTKTDNGITQQSK